MATPCNTLSSLTEPPSPKSKKRRVESDNEEEDNTPGWLNHWVVEPACLNVVTRSSSQIIPAREAEVKTQGYHLGRFARSLQRHTD